MRDVQRKPNGYWILAADVAAFRIYTAFCVPHNVFSNFMYSTDSSAPGIAQVALSDVSGNDIVPAMLNYPLYGTIGDVLHGGHPTAELGYRIRDIMALSKHPYLMPTFLDDHDVDRFFAGGPIAGWRQGLLLIMTLPGIPVIYYGAEQAFTGQRVPMVGCGYASGGHGHFDTSGALYQLIAQLTYLRKRNAVFSRGAPTILDEELRGPGAFTYKMSCGDCTAIVAINTSDTQSLTRTFARVSSPELNSRTVSR